MEDRHTNADDGWEAGVGRQAHRIVGSNTWPQCAFYGVFDGHGGARTATAVSRSLWSDLQGRLVRYCEAASGDGNSGGGLPATDPDGPEPAAEAPPVGAPTIEAPDVATLTEMCLASFAATEADVIAQGRRGRWTDGCTAVTCLLFGRHLIVANLGDSRIVLCTGGKAVRLSEDHKPSNPKELARIQKAGGFVRSVMGISRLNGDLSLSRAFGDGEYKRPASRSSPPARSSPALRASPPSLRSQSSSPPLRAQTPSKLKAAIEAAAGAPAAAPSPAPGKGFARATGATASSPAPSGKLASRALRGVAGRAGAGAALAAALAGAELVAGDGKENGEGGGDEISVSSAGSESTVSSHSGAPAPRSAPPAPAPAEPEGPLSAIPDIFERKLDPADQFLLLACDGVWDVFSDEVAVKHVLSGLSGSGNDPRKAADYLVEQVLRSGRCTDNVTALVVLLKVERA
jgi:serine/threonine protein phosphatase PrpC